ncbi:50S ribosomal protein L15 [Haliangium sp.]|uniref:50S ribosomal protein L15 n=1 Tax=Haliangium sp. TaxID=2663208 RepID=UPI003D1343B4
MGTTLHTLAPNPGATRKRKRVGRGPGSGRGKTSTRGQKGQKARAGHHGARVGFEGGQMPMQRRLPKRGFKNPFRVEAHAVNLGDLAQRFSAGEVVDIDALRAAGLIPRKAKVVKILGGGEIGVALTVRAHRFSKSALAKLSAAGGSAEVLGLDGSAKPATSDSSAAAGEPAPAGETGAGDTE